MSSETFDLKILTEKLSKLNNSQQSIQSLSLWCISHRKKARQVVETWEKTFNLSQKDQPITFLYLANDIIQNSRKKGNEFVNEFWKVLPAALKHVYDNCNQSGKKAATRLVDIWEERKVFGSRIQSLKDAIVAREVKDPTLETIDNEKSSNPIKIVKKDSQSLRIKLSVGGFPEKIVSAFHSFHEECSNEESKLSKCNGAVLSAERIVKDVENNISRGIQPGPGTTDEMQELENVLEQCIGQLERAEATRVALITLLKDAVQDQEVNVGSLRDHLQVARRWINDVRTLRPTISSYHKHAIPVLPAGALTEPLMMEDPTEPASQGTPIPQIPTSQTHQPPSQPATSFASLATNDEDSKKAAAAAVAAKLTASTSSAQMFTSVLSSLMAEQAAKAVFNSSLPMFPPEKRPKLEQQSSGTNAPNFDVSSNSVGPPPLPPTPPPTLLPNNPASTQFVQSGGMMMPMVPYEFSGGNGLPPFPPPPPPLSQPSGLLSPPAQQGPGGLQLLQPPLQPAQPQNGSGGYYRPPGIVLYGSSSQSSTPPVHRHS